MNKLFIIFLIGISLSYAAAYAIGVLCAPRCYAISLSEDSSDSAQEEKENEQQFEENILIASVSVTFMPDKICARYFITNTLIPDALPIPLHEPPPNLS